MLDLRHSLVIEATRQPDYFGFYSPELDGFTGIRHSVANCLYQAKWGMLKHVEVLKRACRCRRRTPTLVWSLRM